MAKYSKTFKLQVVRDTFKVAMVTRNNPEVVIVFKPRVFISHMLPRLC